MITSKAGRGLDAEGSSSVKSKSTHLHALCNCKIACSEQLLKLFYRRKLKYIQRWIRSCRVTFWKSVPAGGSVLDLEPLGGGTAGNKRSLALSVSTQLGLAGAW